MNEGLPGVRIVTITVSDTRTASTDGSGRALKEELASFELVRHEIVPDVADRLRAVVRAAIPDADAIIVTGGTGIAPRDITIETLSPLFEKTLDGFGEAFRRLSWDEVGPRAILSRAAAGLSGTTLLFLLPGSEPAARLGARALIAPILKHAVDLANGRSKHHGHGHHRS
jgi:molybdenum cofactor biosynthesis protein B